MICVHLDKMPFWTWGNSSRERYSHWIGFLTEKIFCLVFRNQCSSSWLGSCSWRQKILIINALVLISLELF